MTIVFYGFENSTTVKKWREDAITRITCNLIRAQHFYIAYNTLHKISFRMRGRSSLYDLWFSQTLRHKNYISIYNIYIYIRLELR